MEVRIARKFTINVRAYESTTVEVEVGASHHDLGYGDDEVAGLSLQDHARLRTDLRMMVQEELGKILKPQLEQADSWSEFSDNIASKALKP